MTALNGLIRQINEAIRPEQAYLTVGGEPVITVRVDDQYDMYPVRGTSKSRVWVIEHLTDGQKLIIVRGDNPDTPFEVLATELLHVLDTPRVAFG